MVPDPAEKCRMTVQILKMGKREFILLAKRDFQRLTTHARRLAEDDYWIWSALDAEAKARSQRQRPIAFDRVERELDARKSRRRRHRRS